jgi:dTDP-4-dehydrorhamnose 3,5-epimerase
MGDLEPLLLVIPPGVAHGMKGIGVEPGYLVNCPSEPYVYDNPDEYRIEPHSGEIPYDWAHKDG